MPPRKNETAREGGGDLGQELIDQLLGEGATQAEVDPWSDQQLQVEIDTARAAAGFEPARPGAPVAATAATAAAPAAPATAVHPVQFMPLQPEPPASDASHGIELLLDVQLQVSVELGRSHMTIGEVLALRTGSVIELDKLAGEPVDVSVNGTLIARGEVVVVDEKFGVRITEVVSKAKRLASLG